MLGPLDASRRLARVVIERLAVPLVYAGHVDLDDAILLLKQGVVSALQGTGKTKALLASHMSKSERWVHLQLKAAKEGSEGSASPEPNSGYRLMLMTAEALARIYPEPATPAEIREALGLEVWQMDDAALAARLELYVALGLVEAVSEGAGAGFRARSDLMVELPGEDRIDKVAERISWIPALAMSNFRGEGEFGGMLAELTPTALNRARARMRKAFAEIMAEALIETHQTEDPTVTVRAVIAMGAVGESDAE